MAEESKKDRILKFVAENPGLKPAKIADALVKQGLAVTAQYVSVTLSNARKAAGKSDTSPKPAAETSPAKPRTARPKAPKIVEPTTGVGASDMHAAKAFVAEVGSVEKAAKALDEYRLLIA